MGPGYAGGGAGGIVPCYASSQILSVVIFQCCGKCRLGNAEYIHCSQCSILIPFNSIEPNLPNIEHCSLALIELSD